MTDEVLYRKYRRYYVDPKLHPQRRAFWAFIRAAAWAALLLSGAMHAAREARFSGAVVAAMIAGGALWASAPAFLTDFSWMRNRWFRAGFSAVLYLAYFEICPRIAPGHDATEMLVSFVFSFGLGWYLASRAWWRGFDERDAMPRVDPP